MAGRMAIDFGTSNTRVALWDVAAQQAEILAIPDIALPTRYRYGGEEALVPRIPSLIHYDGQKVWIGKQVVDRALVQAPATFFWMKRYISRRLELPRQVNGRLVKFSDAGAEFLARVIDYAGAAIGLEDEEVGFTVPVEAYEHFQDWLLRVSELSGLSRYRLLDEASAAALGYGVHIQANDVYMVFDFGGGTLDVSIVKIEGETTGGRRCRVLGKGGAEVGGATIDGWLYQDVLAKNKKAPEDVRQISGLLLMEVERLKEELTSEERADLAVMDPQTGVVLSAVYTRSGFEDLLEEQGFFTSIQSTLDHALAQARERGFERDHIKAVLLVGGSSLIPCVRRVLRQQFGERVKYHRPLEAVALGGAAFVGGVDFYDHIQHDYALRYYNREKEDYDFLVIVPAGTAYPTDRAIKQLTVKASHDHQEFLGLDIYEVGRDGAGTATASPALDLVFDVNGGARFQAREDSVITSHFWVNEKSPTFIRAEPRAQKGDKRFPVKFSIDGNKRLCVTVRDNRTGKTLLRDHPVVRLT